MQKKNEIEELVEAEIEEYRESLTEWCHLMMIASCVDELVKVEERSDKHGHN